MEFTEPTARINASLPADMIAAMRLIQRNEGVPLSRQVRMAMEDWIMNRVAASAEPPEMTPDEFEAKWAEFLRAGRTLVDAPVDYDTEAS